MASKNEIVIGIEQLIQEGRRLCDALTEDQWALVVDLDGWKSKEVLAHVAGIGSMVAPMVGGLSNAPAGADALGSIDIDQLNAGIVGARTGKSAKELADELETSYRGVIEFVRGAPDDLLAKPVTARGYKDVPVSDILVRMVVLHGLAHIYSVYSSVMNA
jgi:mycothiol maleylpyruvate isomerase-like protein